MTLWLDGALVAPDAARIDPADRGFTLGDGIFETIRIVGGRAAHLARHLARLRAGAAQLGIPVPYDDPTLARAMASVLEADAVTEGSARLTVTRGRAPRGVAPPHAPTPTLLITAAQAGPAPAAARLAIARATRRNEHSPLSRLKTLNYLDGIIACREALDRGFDDALLRNTSGLIAEASAACLIVAVDMCLVTPKVTDGALPGIGRALLIERSGVTEGHVDDALLGRATAATLVNSLGIRPVASIEDHALPGSLELSTRLAPALQAGP